MNLDKAIDELIAKEGDYSNDSADLGGATRWGITENEARRNGYIGDMKDLPREFAATIYAKRYWYEPKLDAIGLISERVAEELFDTGVNMGVGKAAEFLQKSLNALNGQTKDCKDIAQDGAIGNKTIDLMKSYINKRGKEGEEVLLNALNCLQGARYIEISLIRKENRAFTYGWLKNRVSLETK